jgi:hypothetical protein
MFSSGIASTLYTILVGTSLYDKCDTHTLQVPSLEAEAKKD